jgi:hypothetical protein
MKERPLFSPDDRVELTTARGHSAGEAARAPHTWLAHVRSPPHPGPFRRGEGDRLATWPGFDGLAEAFTIPFSPSGRRCPKGG